MGQIKQVTVPDIGGADNVEVVEIFAQVGKHIAVEDPLLTLEGDKATMDIPSPLSGQVSSVALSVGDKVSMGHLIVELDVDVSADSDSAPSSPSNSTSKESENNEVAAPITVAIPDLGGASDVKVIEIAVSAGDTIKAEESILTLEGDKASMDIPSPHPGEVVDVLVQVGDTVSTGAPIITLLTDAATAVSHPPKEASSENGSASQPAVTDSTQVTVSTSAGGMAHASPAVRRLARELSVDLSRVTGTGSKGRITKSDLRQHLSGSGTGSSGQVGGLNILSMPTVDFSQFGDIETQPLTKIQRISGANLHRNWVSIPHVTQWADADVTEMEAFRQKEKEALAKQGTRLTPLVFLMKAAVAALKAFPTFNASLSPSGDELILKRYFHIGVAVDTPAGLVVPVIRDVDKKGLVELADELGQVSLQAREKGISMAQMQGGCFTISSLGGIGGTAFTPIINAPEVAILGVSRTQKKPVWVNGQWEPRLMLPLSLSYDHRVIDGAVGARFITYFAQCVQDIRKLLM